MNLPLFQGVIFFILGLVLARFTSLPLSLLFPLAGASAVLLILRKVEKRTGPEARRRWLSSFLIGILIMTAGFARYRLAQKTSPDNIANFASPSVVEVD